MYFTWSEILLRLLAVLLLIAINAFFVTAEFSIVSVRRSRINQLADAGDIQARTVQDLQSSLDRLLSAMQIGITLSSLALGWIGETAMSVLLARGIRQLPLQNAVTIAHSLAVPLTFLLLAYLQIVLGELCPKAVALRYSEQLARFLSVPSLAITRCFTPFIWILNQSTRLLLGRLGIRLQQGWQNQVTSEELQRMIAVSTESTGLEEEERQLLRNVFEFGSVAVGMVMIPRTSVTAIAEAATFRTLLEEVAQSGHSRYPVMGESLDDIRGVIHFRELADPLVQGVLTMDSSIAPWVRPARFVPETLLLSELLPLMQRSRQPMVIVVDEFGGTAGLATVQDLITEILGDPVESFPLEEPTVQILEDQSFLVQAQVALEEVNELLGLDLLQADDYQTLGGFLLFQFQKIPQPGEALAYQDWEFTIVSTEGPRLHQVRVQRLETAPELDNFSEWSIAMDNRSESEDSDLLLP
ncbi:MAG TPA: hemolysin family protein [Thermosynechococcaceae cyanobacterium]